MLAQKSMLIHRKQLHLKQFVLVGTPHNFSDGLAVVLDGPDVKHCSEQVSSQLFILKKKTTVNWLLLHLDSSIFPIFKLAGAPGPMDWSDTLACTHKQRKPWHVSVIFICTTVDACIFSVHLQSTFVSKTVSFCTTFTQIVFQVKTIQRKWQVVYTLKVDFLIMTVKKWQRIIRGHM